MFIYQGVTYNHCPDVGYLVATICYYDILQDGAPQLCLLVYKPH